MLNQHSESVKDCRQALALDPSMDKVYSRAAKGLLLLGDVRAAADVLRSGTQTLSSNLRLREEVCGRIFMKHLVKIDGLLSEVNSELAEKKFEKALSAMESVFRLADPSIKVKSLSGISKLSSDDLQHMCSKWNLLRAKCLIGLRDLGEATRIVQSISNSEPTNSEALTLRAELLYLNDSHGLPHIQQVLQKALTFDPDNRNALTLLRRIKHLESVKKEGNDAYQNGDNASAEALYSKFLDEDSNSGSPGAMGVVRVKVLSNRATVRSKLGKHALAVADCTTAIDLLEKLMFTDSSSSSFSTDPKNSVQSNLFYKLYLRRADSQMKIEKFEEAVRDYTTVNGIKPDREVQSALRKAEAALKQSKRKDYYKILGVDRSAGENEIKKAYRKLALMYHPDKQASLPEEERLQCDGKFKEVSEAYSVLSDPRKKEMFDSGMDVDGSSASGGAGTSPFGFGGGGGLDPDILRMFMQQAGGFHAGGGGGGFNSGGFYGGGGGGGGGFGRSRGSGSWGGSPFG
ncbi:hypothetical protein DFJ73DRAFT_628649 [Zopfochytrium polystomum]|nr:hypothetical protein DFJ73DRAFT_628649 [Zopfochytrium polystomum]